MRRNEVLGVLLVLCASVSCGEPASAPARQGDALGDTQNGALPEGGERPAPSELGAAPPMTAPGGNAGDGSSSERPGGGGLPRGEQTGTGEAADADGIDPQDPDGPVAPELSPLEPGRVSCPASTLPAGNHSLSLEHDGVVRTYLVHVPRGLDPAAPAAMVVDLHGLTSSASAQAALSGWRAKADAEGFIVVHPQGLDSSWNGGELCCGASLRNDVDDEGFIRALVAQMQLDSCVDPRRVYATGLSNGGAMSHLLACSAADIFAATAPVSMGNGTRPCVPARPISVVMTRGTSDALVPFEGGFFPSAHEDFEQWAELNGCAGDPEPQDELCQAYTRCEGGVEVKTCTVDAGHVLYSNRQGFSVPDVVWRTFERQTLP